jgi:uncharacterized protein
MRVLITGGTGLIGRRLVQLLLARGDEVHVLTRRPTEAKKLLGDRCILVEGDPNTPGPWCDALADSDAVLNLAGENVFAHRWNPAVKQTLVESRVKGTHNVVQALLRKPHRQDGSPKVLVNASAIGIYGPHGDEEVTEDTSPGTDFLAELCVQWEKEARQAEASGVRVALVRVGVVLDRAGGALAKLLTPFKLYAGGPVGTGRQWISWIHHDDITGIFLHALDTPAVSGPLNGTAPTPQTNANFGHALGQVLQRPSFVWTPGFALRLGLGEVADVILSGQRVLPRHTVASGYTFRYPVLEEALREILQK